MVACRTVVEYEPEKIRKFCLEKAKVAKKLDPAAKDKHPPEKHSLIRLQKNKAKRSPARPKTNQDTKWSKDRLVKLETQNQLHQQGDKC